MIPFALLSGKLNTVSVPELEFSVLELSGHSFTFRLPLALTPAEPEKLDLRLCFTQPDGQLTQLSPCLTALRAEEMEKYSVVYRAFVADSSYTALVSSFSSRYLRYIDLRLNASDAELSARLCSYPAEKEEVFSSSFLQWRDRTFSALSPAPESLSAMRRIGRFSLALSGREAFSAFLSLPFSDFCSEYWRRALPDAGAFSTLPITCLEIGDAYCSFRCPDEKLLRQLLEKAAEEHLSVSLLLPPMHAGQEAARSALFRALSELPESIQPKELILNDLGTAELLQPFNSLWTLRLGPLFERQPADPRRPWMQLQSGGSCLNADFYLQHLSERYSLRSCCFELRREAVFPSLPAAVFLPYVQTNFSPLCPLLAALEHGGRGAQIPCDSCPESCDSTCFLYPDILQTVGLGNVLWSVRRDSLEHFSLSEHAAADRIVFNFPFGGKP